MKDHGFIALLLVMVYIAAFLSGLLHSTRIDPEAEAWGRVVLFGVAVLFVFATGAFIVSRSGRRWYTGLSVFLLIVIWIGIVLILVISQIDLLGDFRF